MNGYNGTYKRQFKDGELEEAMRVYGNGPSSERDKAFMKVAKAMARVELGESIEKQTAALAEKDAAINERITVINERDAVIAALNKQLEEKEAEIASLRQIAKRTNVLRLEKDVVSEDLRMTQRSLSTTFRVQLPKKQKRQPRQTVKSLHLYYDWMDDMTTLTDDDGFDMRGVITEGNSSFEQINAVLQNLIDKGPSDMSFVSLLSLRYPRAIDVIVDFLLCFAFIRRKVILSIKSSKYEKHLSNFHFNLCCLFCHEIQYKIRLEGKNFYFKFAVDDDDTHVCQLQDLKNCLISRSPAQKDSTEQFARTIEVFGDDVEGIAASALFMGRTARVGGLFEAILSMLTRINSKANDTEGKKTITSLDLRRDCVSAFNEGIKMQYNYERLFNMNPKIQESDGILLIPYDDFCKKWYKRCNEIAGRSLKSNKRK
ncbi:hypothetical protein DAKH74_037470 [Maudiozyma humilis]|uniref:Uncharacterized protein n=1 Tax=Maudiozyma humilis TaxID=51915 RepID=A0AAV5S248_MAUHU|nr:hypothetical protein DAKH74_037470 [Kazachstania humilis]